MTSGVSAVDLLIAAAAAITAIGVIWRKVLRPIISAAKRAEEALPVVLSIAEEFQANGGSSLRDTIDAMASDSKEELAVLSDYAHGFKHDFANRLAVVSGNVDLLTERVAVLGEELGEVKNRVDAMADEVSEVKAIVDPRREPR